MLFRLTEVSKSYGAQEVLRAVNWQLNPGERAGLVGCNGAGKTTLLRLIAGAEMPDSGSIERLKGLRLGVLAQQIDFSGATTVIEAALEVFSSLRALEVRMRELEEAMTEASGAKLEAVMRDYSQAQHAYEREGGFNYHARAEAVLLGLGFSKQDFGRVAESLSGGEKNRLGLARLLLLEADLLLLDEPTNHLDVEAVEWLEDFLVTYPSAYVIVSHDRFFLDHTVTRIIELEGGRIESYRGNYSAYLIERAERRAQQQRAYKQQQELIARTEEFIRRNIAGQKTKQAKSRRKLLEKLERVASLRQEKGANFKLQPSAPTGQQVLVLDRLSIGFPTRRLASEISLILRRGERLGILGSNGTGKTTLLRTLLGELPPLAGEVRWGAGVRIGYYDQRLLMVDDRHTVIEELRSLASSSITDGELRSFLGRFLFSGDEVFKPVAALSGGEKGRLALAKLIYSRANVLVLDEPTNHLDVASREALEEALDDYDGTIIAVSHDRYFLDRVATQILFFGDEGVEHFAGNYTEFYQTHRRARVDGELEGVGAQKARRAARKTVAPTAGGAKKARRKQSTATEIEAEIQAVEAEMQNLAALLATEEIARDWQRLRPLTEQYQELDRRLSELYQQWGAALETGSDEGNDGMMG